MWSTKKFKSNTLMQNWIDKNKHKVQYNIIFINNGFALEFKPLRFIG